MGIITMLICQGLFVVIFIVLLKIGKYTTFEWFIFALGYTQATWGQFYYTFVKHWDGQYKPAKEIWVNGPYKYIRHPYYGGIIIMTLSCVMLSIRTKVFPPLLPFIILITYIVHNSLIQEKDLLRAHPQQAEKYFQETKRRWIPFVL